MDLQASWFLAGSDHDRRRELVLLKGVSVRPVLEGLITPPDLPLLADAGSGLLAFLLIGLAD